MNKYLPLTATSAICILLGSNAANAIQTENRGLHAVPAAKSITIDGKLDDWDLSGQSLITYDVETLKDVYSAQVSVMYDADNLYVSLHWKDPIPMGNTHDPRYQANKGWAGDAVQLRFKTDKISHITAWYYGPKQEPTIQIDYGKSLTEPFGGGSKQLYRTQGWKLEEGAEMGFVKDADGKGYVQEIKLPWKLIADKPPVVGSEVDMGIELLWGEADWPVHRYADNLQPTANSREFFWTAHNAWGAITLEPKGNLTLPEPEWKKQLNARDAGAQGPVDITYTLPKAARVSLSIDDATGKRVRNLVPALSRQAGANVEKWDGLDDDGKPVQPGEYSYKILYHDGIRANYVMSFANPGNPTWATADGRGAFYSDHTAPQAVAAAGDYVGLAAPMGEGGAHLIGTDLTGQRLWGLANRVAFDGGRISLATDGKTLFVGSEGKESIIYRVDIASGKYAPWGQKATDTTGKEFELLDLKVSDLPGYGKLFEEVAAHPTDAAMAPDLANMTAIALRGDVLAVALARDNKVKLLDANTGKTVTELTVSEPRAIAYDAQGNLVVLSKGRLLRVTTKGASSSFAEGTFTNGFGLASDAQGNVYLSVRGADHNVKVFSPTGKALKDIGVKGGRPLVGAYVTGGMRNPAGIAIDKQNRLWVTEETMNPKRTSIWDVKSGKLIKELVGTTTYSGTGSINPFDPTLAFSDNTVYRIDLKKGEWRPIFSLGQSTNPDDIFPPATYNITNKIIKRGNLTYIYTTGSARGAVETHVTLWDGKSFRSVAHLGQMPFGKDRESEYAKFKHPFFAGQEGKSYSWTDANADGIVQQAELKFVDLTLDGKKSLLQSNYWGQLPNDEGTVSYMARVGDKVAADKLYQFVISGYNKVNAPIYDIAKPKLLQLSQPLIKQGEGMYIGGKDGQTYLNQDPVFTIDRNGKVLGNYPSRHVSVHGSHTARAAKSGYLIGPSSIQGVANIGGDAGEVFYLNGNLGENYLFTEDGLYIQTLFKDTRGYFDNPTQAVRGMSMDAITAGGESFGGNFVKTPDGKTYLTMGGTDARVLEISGLSNIKRLSGKFSYTPEKYALAQTELAARVAQSSAPRAYTVGLGIKAPNIDGNASEWPELLNDDAKVMEIQESQQQRFGRVAMRYDADNLYLGYRVFSSRGPLTNAGQNSKLLFKSGDVVDLMVGPARDDANNAVAGDTRIILTTMGGKPTAVLNQKVAPNANAAEKFDFSSPWRTISFDRVAEAPEVKLATSPINSGYFVEAAIPWKTLGIKPEAGLKLRGDVGVLFADNGGTTTVSRQYWSNKATGLVNDVPGEADLTPSLWGTFTLE